MPAIDTVEQRRSVYAQRVGRAVKKQLSRFGNVVAVETQEEMVERYRTPLY